MNNLLPILLVSFNLIILILLFFYWSFLLIQDKKLRSQKNKFSEESEQIIKRAHTQAEKIIADAHLASKGLENTAQKTFEKAVEEIKNETTNFYKLLESKYSIKQEQFINILQEQSLQEIESLGDKTESSLKKANTALINKVKHEFEKARLEIDEYKKVRINNIESEIVQKVEELARQLLPQTITIESHEKMVLMALEKAKEEGLLNQ